jgi:hypothetical protein
MKKLVTAIAVTSLLIGTTSGFIAGKIVSDQEHKQTHVHSHDTPAPAHNDGHGATSTPVHKHATLAADPTKAPTVALKVTKDSKAGWYVHIDTTNFSFTPAKANTADILGEGHAHLYVDGKIVSRLYGPDFHYRENFTGTKTFKVTLNGNTHADYTVNGTAVSAEQKVTDDRQQ